VQLTIDINDTVSDKILYFLEHFQDDVKIISQINTPLNIEPILESEPDYQIILKGREERKTNPENYGTLDDIDWN
jgi:hypothetical protein